MDSFLLVDGEDMNFILKTIQEQQMIFHPSIAPDGKFDYKKFYASIDKKSLQMWLLVAEGRITEIPKIHYSQTPAKNITVDYSIGGDHYDMAVASLLQVVQLYRNKDIKPVEKVKSFFKWMYENLLVCEYLLVYATMLFTEQENIRAPKNANSDDINKIVAGCENLAWDISYLTNWSTLYEHTEKYDKEFLFATNDILLKRIFINKNGPYGLNGLLYEVFSKKDYNQLLDYIEEKMRDRVKPSFGGDTHKYFQKVIESEKRQLELLLRSDCT